MKSLTSRLGVTVLLMLVSVLALAKHPQFQVEYLGAFTKEQAAAAAQKIPPISHLPMHYSLFLYKIYYTTPAPDGSDVWATGLVVTPINPNKATGIVSYAHGTRVNRDDVPSRNNEKNYIYLATFASSAGYVLVMPDYLGYGDSTLPLHPYVDADTLASSSINLLLAAKEFLTDMLHYPINNELYLAGYSEGGFTTNVTYEKLLNEYPELPVTAVASGSAPYDWNLTMKFVADNPGPRSTVYLALFMYAMQTYHHYWDSLEQIFSEPYASLIPVLFDGKHQTQEILDALPKDPHLIFNPGIIEAIIDGSNSHSDEMQRNFNHYAFTATSPMLIVGTKGDHDVPFEGAEMAYQILKQKSDRVYLKSVSDVLDHLQAFPVVTLAQMQFFQQYTLHPPS